MFLHEDADVVKSVCDEPLGVLSGDLVADREDLLLVSLRHWSVPWERCRSRHQLSRRVGCGCGGHARYSFLCLGGRGGDAQLWPGAVDVLEAAVHRAPDALAGEAEVDDAVEATESALGQKVEREQRPTV